MSYLSVGVIPKTIIDTKHINHFVSCTDDGILTVTTTTRMKNSISAGAVMIA